VPLTPRGAGTGVEGGAIPLRRGLVLDSSRLDGITILPAERVAIVGAGVRKLDLKRAAARHGLCFGPDPSSNPSLGGMASTSASGMTTLRYGTTRENVVSMRVVTPQGDVIRTRTAVRKSSTGLELNQLYLGAEGTLGVIAELTLRLFPEPTARTGCLLPFASVADAAACVVALLQAALPTLLRCELLNTEAITATNAMFAQQLPPRPTLFLECAGAELRHTRRDAAAAVALARAHGAEIQGDTALQLTEGDALESLWETRRGCYPASLRAVGATAAPRKVLITDVCVPLAALPRVIAATEADFLASKLQCILCAHIADGNFHCLVPYAGALEAAAAHAAEERMIARAIEAGGTVSGEHGVGMGKIAHCLCEHGAAHLGVQAAIKHALDPRGLMNPGKVYHVAQQQQQAARARM
jgi:D-lactate dehydrogenase (cytochrome)